MACKEIQPLWHYTKAQIVCKMSLSVVPGNKLCKEDSFRSEKITQNGSIPESVHDKF